MNTSARENQPADQPLPVHYRIFIYMESAPPLGVPVGVSLCPWRRGNNGELTGDVDRVTCPRCLKHIRDIGLTNAM